MAGPNPKKARNARSEGRQAQWYLRKRRGVKNGWTRRNITYIRPDRKYSFTPGGGENVPWKPTTEPAVQPILADLETARTNVILNSAPTDTLATNALNAAIAKLNALKGEDVSAIVAKCNSAKANIALLTGPGDTAALADILAAKTLVGTL